MFENDRQSNHELFLSERVKQNEKIESQTDELPSSSTWDKIALQYSISIDDGEFELAKEILALLKKHGVAPGSKLLELGCGSGHLSACLAMAGYHTSLLDFSPESLTKARQTYQEYNLDGEFILGDIMDLDEFQENDYDLVWNSGVMEHFSDNTICVAFDNISKIAHNHLLVLVPNPLSISYLLMRYVRQAQNDWPYGKEYLRSDYIQAMKTVGFQVITVHYLASAATRHNFNVAMKDAEFCDAYFDLLERGLLPEQEQYLVGFFSSASPRESEPEYNPQFKANTATLFFDINAERYGLSKELSKIKLQIDRVQNILNSTMEELNHRTEELNQTQEKSRQIQEELERSQEMIGHLKEENDQTSKKLELEEREKAVLYENTILLKEQIDTLNTQLSQTNAVIANVRSITSGLMNTRLNKIVHLWSRFKYQLIMGSFEEKKNFFRWLRAHFSRLPYKDAGYHPLLRILSATEQPHQYIESEKNSHTMDVHKTALLDKDYRKFDLIILSIIDFSFRRQRPQHIASHFAADGHRVFYFNANHHRDFSIKEESENLYIIDLWNPESTAIHTTDWTNRILDLQAYFDCIANQYAIRDAVILVDYPNWIHGAIYLRSKYGFKIITDYMDDFTGFLNPAHHLVTENCLKLLRESDRVIASSQFLHDIAIRYNKNVEIIRNGTEYTLFSRAYSTSDRKERKTIGYYGAIAHWFHCDIVCYVADKLTDCDIILIGEVTEHHKELQKHKNIKFIGEIPYGELPDYLVDFDVCLIPFDTSTDLIKATNPVKFYEYLSAGKKVVSTEIPELEPYRDEYVLMSNDKDVFLAHIKSCLDGTDTLQNRESLMEMGRANDWKERYSRFLQCCKMATPLVSVIVLTYNNIDLNKLCISSIQEKTAYPNYELIIVDNASVDGTQEYLSEFNEQTSENVSVILNENNLGFAGGNNIGIKQATGDYVILLNNDTIITRGWVTALVKHLENNEKMGMSGSVTNSIGNEAKITANYTSLTELNQFADAYTWEHMGEIYHEEPGVLAMFAICIKREVIEKCGYLDESYSVGMFEDDDYSRAVKYAGYNLCIAEDSFVHHFDGASFKKIQSKEYIALFNQNKMKFNVKWETEWKGHKYRDGVDASVVNAQIVVTNEVRSSRT